MSTHTQVCSVRVSVKQWPVEMLVFGPPYEVMSWLVVVQHVWLCQMLLEGGYVLFLPDMNPYFKCIHQSPYFFFFVLVHVHVYVVGTVYIYVSVYLC